MLVYCVGTQCRSVGEGEGRDKKEKQMGRERENTTQMSSTEHEVWKCFSLLGLSYISSTF